MAIFSGIQSAEELKELLGLEDERPLWVVRLMDEEKFCTVDDCPFPPLMSNKGKCALHCQQWWPTSTKERGYLLVDPEFLEPQKTVCCCRDETCFAIGHSPFGYIPIPRQKQYRKDIVRSMKDALPEDIQRELLMDETTTTTQQKKKNANKQLYLAPWHFYPEHRALDRREKKMVIKKPRGGLRDYSGKHYYFPPANFSPREFVNTELAAAVLPRQGLPAWVQDYKEIEAANPDMVTHIIFNKEENNNKIHKDTSVDETVAETVLGTDLSHDSGPAYHQTTRPTPTPPSSNGVASGKKSTRSSPGRKGKGAAVAFVPPGALSLDDGGANGAANSLTEPLLSSTNNEENCDNNDTIISDSYVHVSSEEVYAPDSQRFIVLAVYCACNLLASAEWITFAPVEDAVRVRYNISSSQVNWLSMIFMATYGPGTFLASWWIRKFGLRSSIVTSAFVMALGSLMRWGSAYLQQSSGMAYIVLLSGQGLVAFAQPVFANTPARVASAWFAHTTNAVGFAVFAAMIGMVLGQAMSPLIVTESNGNHLDQLLAGQAICMVLCAIATWCWFKSEPAVPPSAAEAARRHSEQNGDSHSSASLWKDICKLCTDFHYIIMLVAFGIGYGINNAVLTLLQPWIAGVGFPGDKVAGLCGSLVILGGLLGTLIAAPLLDASRNYNRAVRWSFMVQFAVAVAAVATLQPTTSIWVLAAAFTAIGMSQCPLLTICLDASAAHTYPISEELSSAGLQLGGQYLGVAFTNGMGALLDEKRGAVGYSAPINIAFLSLLGAASFVALFYNGDDPRADANANASAQPEGSNETSQQEHDEENPE